MGRAIEPYHPSSRGPGHAGNLDEMAIVASKIGIHFGDPGERPHGTLGVPALLSPAAPCNCRDGRPAMGRRLKPRQEDCSLAEAFHGTGIPHNPLPVAPPPASTGRPLQILPANTPGWGRTAPERDSSDPGRRLSIIPDALGSASNVSTQPTSSLRPTSCADASPCRRISSGPVGPVQFRP